MRNSAREKTRQKVARNRSPKWTERNEDYTHLYKSSWMVYIYIYILARRAIRSVGFGFFSTACSMDCIGAQKYSMTRNLALGEVQGNKVPLPPKLGGRRKFGGRQLTTPQQQSSPITTPNPSKRVTGSQENAIVTALPTVVTSHSNAPSAPFGAANITARRQKKWTVRKANARSAVESKSSTRNSTSRLGTPKG